MAGKASAPLPRTDTRVELVAKLVAATPFALATLAALYDAGYFTRIGSDFFPLFSLIEHLMFGMRGIPYLLVILVLSYFALVTTLRARPGDAAERQRAEKQYYGFLAAVFVISGIGSLFLYPGAWPNAALCFVAALMLWLWTLVEGPVKAPAIIAANFLMWLVASFAAGYWMAAGMLNPRDAPIWQWWSAVPVTTILLNDGPPLSGRILGAGERGLLLFNTIDGSIQLKRWDAVRGIELMP